MIVLAPLTCLRCLRVSLMRVERVGLEMDGVSGHVLVDRSIVC